MFTNVCLFVLKKDTIRDSDVRGFAIKFDTDDSEGIWDLVGNNIPVFFI